MECHVKTTYPASSSCHENHITCLGLFMAQILWKNIHVGHLDYAVAPAFMILSQQLKSFLFRFFLEYVIVC